MQRPAHAHAQQQRVAPSPSLSALCDQRRRLTDRHELRLRAAIEAIARFAAKGEHIARLAAKSGCVSALMAVARGWQQQQQSHPDNASIVESVQALALRCLTTLCAATGEAVADFERHQGVRWLLELLMSAGRVSVLQPVFNVYACNGIYSRYL